MRILFVSSDFQAVDSFGYGKLGRQVVDQLRVRGHQVEILTGAGSSLEGELVLARDCSLSALHRAGEENARRCQEWIRRTEPEAMLCWSLDRLGSGLLGAAQRSGLFVGCVVHDTHLTQLRFTETPRTARQMMRSVLELLLPSGTLRSHRPLPLVLSSSNLKKLLLELELPVEGAPVIWPAVDASAIPFRPRPRRDREPIELLSVGPWAWDDGFRAVLRAVFRLPVPFRLTLVGPVSESVEAEIRALAGSGVLTHQIELLDAPNDKGVDRFYSNYHLFLNGPREREVLDLRCLEAMASGSCVISTSTSAEAEFLAPTQNALMVEAGNESELFRKILLLFGGEDYRRRLCDNARRAVEERHNLVDYVSKLEGALLCPTLAKL